MNLNDRAYIDVLLYGFRNINVPGIIVIQTLHLIYMK